MFEHGVGIAGTGGRAYIMHTRAVREDQVRLLILQRGPEEPGIGMCRADTERRAAGSFWR